MKINYTEMGLRIKNRRKELHLKQNELAELADLSNNYLSNIENGYSIPSLEAIVNLCTALGVTPDFLLLGTIRGGNVALDIIDNLNLCSERNINLVKEFIIILNKYNK